MCMHIHLLRFNSHSSLYVQHKYADTLARSLAHPNSFARTPFAVQAHPCIRAVVTHTTLLPCTRRPTKVKEEPNLTKNNSFACCSIYDVTTADGGHVTTHRRAMLSR